MTVKRPGVRPASVTPIGGGSAGAADERAAGFEVAVADEAIDH